MKVHLVSHSNFNSLRGRIMSATKAHILVYPVVGSGHIIPLIDLTRLLLTRGLTVTFAVTAENLSLLDPLLSTHKSSFKTLLLPTFHEAQIRRRLMLYHDMHYPLLLQCFNSSNPSPPIAILSDFFVGWTNQLASEVGVPRVVFSPSGGFSMSMSFTLWRDLPKVSDPTDLNSLLELSDFPNCPSLPWYQIPQLYRYLEEGDPDWEFHRNCTMGNIASWGIVLNTTNCLEQVYLDRIKKQVGHNRVWAVGPLLPENVDLAIDRGGASSVPCHELMSWLDARAEGSVVYVSFGSRVVLTRKQTDELAASLDKSGTNFIWCVKEPKGGKHMAEDHGTISKEFEERVRGRGYVIRGWAPQVKILRHRATGAFLTHCGWNSTLEGLAAGVVMLTWPMGAEQFLNARLLVEQLGVGISVGEGDQKIPNPITLASLLVEALDRTRPERVRVEELRDMVLAGVKEEGSSTHDLNEFVNCLFEIKREN